MSELIIALLALGFGFCVGILFTASTMLRLYDVREKQKDDK
jgi:hypothetical protein